MLLILTTLLVVFAAAALAIVLKRLSDQKFLEDSETRVRLDAETYRPLFAPSDEDLRLTAAKEKHQLKAKEAADERQQREEKLAELEKLRQSWFRSPTRAATIDLLHRYSQVGNGDSYLSTCDSVVAAWKGQRLSDVSPDDLVQLLETHYWLLPADQRTPGASFRLKQAVAGLDKK